MKKNDWRPKKPQPGIACVFMIGGLILMTGSSHAVTAAGIASAPVPTANLFANPPQALTDYLG